MRKPKICNKIQTKNVIDKICNNYILYGSIHTKCKRIISKRNT